MPAPYTIRIFVVDGDPDGVRIIDRFNWTGKGFFFPRTKWGNLRTRPELNYAGVYVLFADAPSNDELPIVYVGEGDGIRDRIDEHIVEKDFWSWGVVFVSANRGLNKAHVQWLEHALLDQARQAGCCTLDNGNVLTAPDLTESETADVQGFLREILQILPLVGLRVFEIPAAVATLATSGSSAPAPLPVAHPPLMRKTLIRSSSQPRKRASRRCSSARTASTRFGSRVVPCRRSDGSPPTRRGRCPPSLTTPP